MTPANDNSRPPEFDARLLSYLPGIKRLAYKFGYRGDDAAELVQETMTYALEHWQNFREEGGFYSWVAFQMRGVISNSTWTRKNRQRLMDEAFPEESRSSLTMPNQEQYAELCETLRSLSARDGGVLIRIAMGDELRQIAGDMGVSIERARQLGARARARLVKEAA